MAGNQINVKITGDTAELKKALRGVERDMRRVGSGLKTVGDNIFRSVGLPFIAAGVAGVKMASDLESSFSKIETLVGITGQSLKDMKSGVRDLSGQVGKSQKELADALFAITSGGLRGSQAMELLEQSAKASAMGLGDLTSIGRTAAAVMTAYKKEGMTAARATDVLTATVRAGNLEASELAGAIGRVLPNAQALGVSFEEVGANIAMFTRMGISSSQAVTGLNSVLNGFIKVTPQAEAVMEEYGLTADEVRKSLSEQGLAGTLKLLMERTGGNIEALGKVIPNVEALTNVLATAGAQGKDYAEVLMNLRAAAGIVDEGFVKVTETAEQQMKQAFVDLQNAGIDLGNALIPVVTAVAAKISDLAKWFSGLEDSTKKTIIKTLAFVTAGGLLLSITGRMILSAQALTGAFVRLGGAKLIAATRARGLAGSLTVLGKGIATAAWPVAILAAGLEGFVQTLKQVDTWVGKIARQLFVMNDGLRNLTMAWLKLTGRLDKGTDALEEQENQYEMTTDELARFQQMMGIFNEAQGIGVTATQKLIEATEAQRKKQEELRQVFTDLRNELGFLTEKQKLFGEELSVEKVDAYHNAIDGLLRQGLTAASPAVQKLTNDLRALNSELRPQVESLPTVSGGPAPTGVKSQTAGPIDLDQGDLPAMAAYLDIMTKLRDEGDRINATFAVTGDVMGMLAAQFRATQEKMILLKEEGIAETSPLFMKLAEDAKALSDQMLLLNFGEELARNWAMLAKSGEMSFKKLGRAALAAAGDVLRAKVVEAVSSFIADSFAKFGIFGAIAAAAAGGIVNGLMSGAIAKVTGGVPKLAQGGLAMGPTTAIVGDNPNARIDPEVIAPLSKLQGMMGGRDINLTGEFRVKGTDLVLSLERTQTQLQARRGYGLNGA